MTDTVSQVTRASPKKGRIGFQPGDLVQLKETEDSLVLMVIRRSDPNYSRFEGVVLWANPSSREPKKVGESYSSWITECFELVPRGTEVLLKRE